MVYSKLQSDIVYRTPFVYVDRYSYSSEAAELKERELAAGYNDEQNFELPIDGKYKLSRTHGINGFGLKTNERIPAGVPVACLFGKKMLPIEAIGSNFKMVESPSGQIISFEERAGISYYIKGSCDPNLVLKWIWVGGKEYGVFFSKKDIEAGTELSVDYLHILRYDEKNILCDCGSTKCRVGLAAKLPKTNNFCILCPGRIFDSYNQAHQHRVIQHIYRGRMPCQYRLCDRWFRSFGAYENHLRIHHANEPLNEMTGRENYNMFPCPNMCGFVGKRPKLTVNHMLECYAVPPSIANRGMEPQIDAQRLMEGSYDEDNDEEEIENDGRHSTSGTPPTASPNAGVDCRKRRAGKGALSPTSPVLGPDDFTITTSPANSSSRRSSTPSRNSSARNSPALSRDGQRIITPPFSVGRKTPSPCTPPRPLWNNSTSLQSSPVTSHCRRSPTSPVCSIASSADTVPIPRNLNQALNLAGSKSPSPTSHYRDFQTSPPASVNGNVVTPPHVSPNRLVRTPPPASPNRMAHMVNVEEGDICNQIELGRELMEALASGEPERFFQAQRRLFIYGQVQQGIPEDQIVIDEARCRQVSRESMSSKSSSHPFSPQSPPPPRKGPVRKKKAAATKRTKSKPSVNETPSRQFTPAIPRRRLIATQDYIPVPRREMLPRKAKHTERTVPTKQMVTTKSIMRLNRVVEDAEKRNLETSRTKRKAVLSPEDVSSSTKWTTRRSKRNRKDNENENEDDDGMFIPAESSNARYLRNVTTRKNRRDDDDDGNGLVC